MMAVLVGLVLQLNQDGWESPSSIFFLMTAGTFIFSAILHPQEFWCLPTGLIYYLTVPSMYLLLIIYSVCNLNNVSWGTREAPVKKKKADAAKVRTKFFTITHILFLIYFNLIHIVIIRKPPQLQKLVRKRAKEAIHLQLFFNQTQKRRTTKVLSNSPLLVSSRLCAAFTANLTTAKRHSFSSFLISWPL